MGLEGVELVLATEEKYGISISDEEAQECLTVGEFYRLILDKTGCTGKRMEVGCLNVTVFNRLRRALMVTLSVQRSAVCPERMLCDLVPMKGRKTLWKRIAEESGLSLPRPQARPKWLEYAMIAMVCGGAMSFPLWFLEPALNAYSMIALMISVPAGALLAAAYVLQRRRRKPYTVGDWVVDTVAINAPKLRSEIAPSWDTDQVWQELCRCIGQVAGVKRETIAPETRFIQDLGF